MDKMSKVVVGTVYMYVHPQAMNPYRVNAIVFPDPPSLPQATASVPAFVPLSSLISFNAEGLVGCSPPLG